MNEPVFVIVKPDGMLKVLAGHVLERFTLAGLDLVAVKLTSVTKELAEEHYRHIKDTPFYKGVIEYLIGNYHGQNKVMACIFYGPNAIQTGRSLAGATNPEEAEPSTLRGASGRITTKGLFENVVHVSANAEDTEREIKLWFSPNEIITDLYPEKIKTHSTVQERIWQ